MKRRGLIDDSEFEKEIAELIKQNGVDGKATGAPEERAKAIKAVLSELKFDNEIPKNAGKYR